jgi:hypothetical protein
MWGRGKKLITRRESECHFGKSPALFLLAAYLYWIDTREHYEETILYLHSEFFPQRLLKGV